MEVGLLDGSPESSIIIIGLEVEQMKGVPEGTPDGVAVGASEIRLWESR